MQNIFAQGMQALDDSYARQQGLRQDRGRNQAARQIASGDYRGAAEAYGQAGMDKEAAGALDAQRGLEQDAHTRERQQTSDANAETARKVELLGKVAQGLKTVPAGQRKAALDQMLPVFQQVGVDPSMFGGLTEDQLTDPNLDAFSGEIEKQWQAVNLGNGGFGSYNSRTGDFKTLREPDHRPVIIGNGGVALDPDTGQVVGRNPKTFAPQRPSGGGGAPSGGPKPWERRW